MNKAAGTYFEASALDFSISSNDVSYEPNLKRVLFVHQGFAPCKALCLAFYIKELISSWL